MPILGTSAFISQLTSWAVDIVSTLGYPGIILVMALENIFPPIPSEAVMPLAGYLTTTGELDLYLTIFSGILGSLLGALFLYYLGALIDGSHIRKFLSEYGKYLLISTTDLDISEQWFNRHGEKAVLLARVAPLVRSVVSIPAGFINMPLKRFIAFSVIGIAVWTIAETFVGVFLGRNWERLEPTLKRVDFAVVIFLFLLVLFFLARRYRRQRTANRIGE